MRRRWNSALPPQSRGLGDVYKRQLYALRKRLAAKQNVPAYMVFSDATLREMVQSKPLSMDEFLNITGVGEKKAARYGMAFLRAIEDMVGSRE